MRQYLLDSAPLAAYLNGRQVAVDLISPWITRRGAATSILVYGEITEYLKGLSHFSRRHAQLRRLLREVYPYFLTYAILDRYADIRRQLRPPHGPGLIGDIDTLIAAVRAWQLRASWWTIGGDLLLSRCQRMGQTLLWRKSPRLLHQL
jgi:predicted nucleic acid-binding protein